MSSVHKSKYSKGQLVMAANDGLCVRKSIFVKMRPATDFLLSAKGITHTRLELETSVKLQEVDE